MVQARQLALVVSLCGLLASGAMAQKSPTLVADQTSADHLAGSSAGTPQFTEVASALGINFKYLASHTSRKYLIETMGSGVALFDYDNDGRLDIFVVNGAPLSDPTPKGTIPEKIGAAYWNRLYHQKVDGTFEDRQGWSSALGKGV
jgi:enediyne biosynthesis protein E4